jgi:predicted KAP-like P-loop ATPase
MFDADRAIANKEQDRLDRAIFAKYLARCILDHEDSQSLVIGLYGGYGSGKTSIINLMLEELDFAASYIEEEQKPIILNFSPWSYSGQNQLIFSFFRRLSSALRQATNLHHGEKIIHLLELYASFFTHKPVPKALRLQRSILKQWLNREDAYGWESGRDLTAVKAELNELLRKEQRKIIIIIDNISRLNDEEIKQMFQIVKSMSDYTNTVYLLALDKEHVVKAINRMDGGGGEDLLEKVVQLPFEVPIIARQDIENILLDKLKLVMPYVSPGEWNSAAWTEVYYASLRYFFENCRDISRYVNALSFSYPRVKDVVNAVDFFALTAIEVFLPKVYAGIHENKDLFTDLVERIYQADTEKMQRDKLRCEEILNREAGISREILLRLILFLFPRLRRLYQPGVSYYYSEMEARKYRRISSADMFEPYFRLSMQPGYISEDEVRAILQLASEREVFSQALARLNQDNRIIKFLDLFDSDFIAKIPSKNIVNIIDALLDDGDLFPEEEASPLRLNTASRINKIISQLLHRFDTQTERFTLLKQAISNTTKSLYIIVQEIRSLEQQHQEGASLLPLEYREVTPEQLHILKKLAVEKILFWVKTDRLIEHPRLLSILFAWKDWGNPEECKQYIEKKTLEDQGLIAFLVAAFKETVDQALNKYDKNISGEKGLANVSAFVLPKWLEPHAKLMFEDISFDRLREKEQLALMIFLKSMGTETHKLIP